VHRGWAAVQCGKDKGGKKALGDETGRGRKQDERNVKKIVERKKENVSKKKASREEAKGNSILCRDSCKQREVIL